MHLGAEAAEGVGREAGVRAVGAVDDDPQPGQIRAESLEHVLEVRVGRDLDAFDRALILGRRSGEQRLDLLLGFVGELPAATVEELDPVVLGRVVRGGDDAAEVERLQRHGRSRQHPGDHAVAAGRDDTARERLLELDARLARIPADEDLLGAGPERGRPPETFDQLRRQELANDATHTIGAEVPPRHN